MACTKDRLTPSHHLKHETRCRNLQTLARKDRNWYFFYRSTHEHSTLFVSSCISLLATCRAIPQRRIHSRLGIIAAKHHSIEQSIDEKMWRYGWGGCTSRLHWKSKVVVFVHQSRIQLSLYRSDEKGQSAFVNRPNNLVSSIMRPNQYPIYTNELATSTCTPPTRLWQPPNSSYSHASSPRLLSIQSALNPAKFTAKHNLVFNPIPHRDPGCLNGLLFPFSLFPASETCLTTFNVSLS